MLAKTIYNHESGKQLPSIVARTVQGQRQPDREGERHEGEEGETHRESERHLVAPKQK